MNSILKTVSWCLCIQVVRPRRHGGLVVGFRMRQPGAHNKTRFMHAAIYLIKIALLSDQFRLPRQLKRQVLALSEFVCLLYVPYFLQSTLPAAAPRLDRDFRVDLQSYRVWYTMLLKYMNQSKDYSTKSTCRDNINSS
jgi:hypothetical protein